MLMITPAIIIDIAATTFYLAPLSIYTTPQAILAPALPVFIESAVPAIPRSSTKRCTMQPLPMTE